MVLYRLLLTLATPALLGRLLWRRLRGREGKGDLGQRLGGGAGRPGALWIHGASNGELTSARALIAALLDRYPEAHLVVTSNTQTGRALVAGWSLPRTTARLAPLDLRMALFRFRRTWRPRLLIVLENELWPNRLFTAMCPVAGIGARMSARSFRRWQRFPRLAHRLLSRIDLLCPQDAASARHFRDLGLPEAHLGPTGTLKSAVDLPAPDPAEHSAFAQIFTRADTLLAASTHAGEDDIVLNAFLAARRTRPRLKLILAPRHPSRAAALEQAMRATGLPYAHRTAGGPPAPETVLFLADTMGEMPLWYSLAGATFVGGSLVPRGGHTPYEPAAAGSAILHGPDTGNFQEPFAALDTGGGALCVEDAASLADALIRLSRAEAQAAQAARARAILADTAQPLIPELLSRLHKLLSG